MSNSLTFLTSSMSIGNSLSSLNQNYLALDQLVRNIQLSATNFWIPTMQYYESKKKYYADATKRVKNNFINWKSSSTTFETNSAKWITPIVTFYPCIIENWIVVNEPSKLQDTFLEWLNVEYPVFPNKTNRPSYLEGQKIIIYSFNYAVPTPTQNKFNNSATTTCITQDQNVCAYCSQSFTGEVPCAQGKFYCDKKGTKKCSKCEKMVCIFDNGKSRKNSTIIATINVNFQNKYETTQLNAYVFKIENCAWVFDKFLTPA